MNPAYFPAAYPTFRPEVQCFRGLFLHRNGAWVPVANRPGQHTYRALWPEHFLQYDARGEYPELFLAAPPYYFAGLWVLTNAGNWELARSWTNYGDCKQGCPPQ